MNTTSTAAATECNMCRYTSGHTSWCPNGDGSPLVTADEQAAIDTAVERAAAEPLTLSSIAAAAREDATLNAYLTITNLGGGVMALADPVAGLVVVMNGGQESTVIDADGPADLAVCLENDPSTVVAEGLVRTVNGALELLGTVVGRG